MDKLAAWATTAKLVPVLRGAEMGTRVTMALGTRVTAAALVEPGITLVI
jgi:hypothetical protein